MHLNHRQTLPVSLPQFLPRKMRALRFSWTIQWCIRDIEHKFCSSALPTPLAVNSPVSLSWALEVLIMHTFYLFSVYQIPNEVISILPIFFICHLSASLDSIRDSWHHKGIFVNLHMSTENPSSVFINRQDPQTLPMSSPRSRVKKLYNEAY